MKVSDYINPQKKKPWRRLIYNDHPGGEGPTYKVLSQEDFLNEVNSAAHKINSPMMSRRPVYGPTGEKNKDGKDKWAIVGYDMVETVPVAQGPASDLGQSHGQHRKRTMKIVSAR